MVTRWRRIVCVAVMTMGPFSGCFIQHDEPEFRVVVYWQEAREGSPERPVVGVSNRLREIGPGKLSSAYEKSGDKRKIKGQDYHGVVVLPDIPAEGQGERQPMIEAFVRKKPGALRVAQLYLTCAVPVLVSCQHTPGATVTDAKTGRVYEKNHWFAPGVYLSLIHI